MTSSALGWVMTQDSFTTPEMREIFSEKARIQKWLDIEATLAEVEAEVGLIPRHVAAEIVRNCRVERIDMNIVLAESSKTKHALVPVLRALQSSCQPPAGEYIHFGPTTQDILDTGLVLQLREAHHVIVRDLKKVAGLLADLALRYKDTPMAGRTHGQQGLPTTFGFKMAVILAEVGRHIERLHEVEKRVFVGVLSGAVGTYASFGPHGREVERRVMQRLGLGVPEICWHSARDRLAEYINLLAMIGGTLGKLGNEFYELSRPELDEVEEPFVMGKVGSSTMPHKRNPVLAEQMNALSRLIRYHAALMNECMIVEHEREAMSWRPTWVAVPESCQYAGKLIALAIDLLSGPLVKPEKMRRNLELLGGLLASERVMFALAEELGKQSAHEVVYELAMAAANGERTFRELLLADERVRQALTPQRIDELLDPSSYLGLAAQVVEEVVEQYRPLWA